MGQKAEIKLVDAMLAEPGVDFTLAQIHRLVARGPQAELNTDQLHSRCSRAIGGARVIAKARGYVIVKGELRHSYRAEKRTYSPTKG